jgi:hypothetical protein
VKVAIVGGGPGWDKAPFTSHDEVWVLGNQMDRYQNRRVTRIFEIHENLDNQAKGYPMWLIAHNIPMIVSDKFPLCNHAEVFDYETASKIIGENFSSSVAVMMAQAIMCIRAVDRLRERYWH